MFKLYLGIFFSLYFLTFYAQDSLLIGKKYREDQIYVNITYNSIINKPKVLTQQGISIGLHSGFVRDIPLNERGNLALGIGLGYGYDKYQTNLIYNLTENKYKLANETYKKNKIETHAIEVPLEFRFRTSNPTEYKFWRVYLGGKITYNIFSKIAYISEANTIRKYPAPFTTHLHYGPQLSIGYNAWNIYAFWDSKPIFENAPETEYVIPNKLQNLKFGFQIYMF